jgi:3-hydroxyisobutyrate dehydrogenase-like beta-hydroxyacid dehydrogenase
MIATCEAFALADKLGLDRQKMFDVVSTLVVIEISKGKDRKSVV